MHVKSILNRIQKFKSFVYKGVRRVDGLVGQPAIVAELRPRNNSQPDAQYAVGRHLDTIGSRDSALSSSRPMLSPSRRRAVLAQNRWLCNAQSPCCQSRIWNSFSGRL